jgi:hypothetical protein
MSTLEPAKVSLPERAEALLDGWPAPSRSAIEWEDAANGVMSRMRDTAIGSTPADLLGPPLPEEAGEPSVAGPERGGAAAPPGGDEPMLASIARAMVAPGSPPLPSSVAREGILAAAQGRRSQAPPSPSGSVASEALLAAAQSRRSRPVPAPSVPAPSAEAAPREREEAQPLSAPVSSGLKGGAIGHEAAARSDLPAPHSHPRGPRRLGFGAGLVGGSALALAAAAVLYLTLGGRAGEVPAVLSGAAAERASPGALAPAAGARSPSPSTPALALDDLPGPNGRTQTQAAAAAAPAASNPGLSATRDGLAFRVKGGPKGAGKLVLEERPDEAADEPPAQAESAAKGKNAAPESEGTPPRPSVGAVQAAVGSVMAGARSCLAGQEQGSRATITFGSDGRAQGVAVVGPAAGTPAESCVRSALMAARVAPFSEGSFSAALTVRPP